VTATAPTITVAAGALVLSPANYLPSTTSPPPGGYAFVYVDPSSTSNLACLNGSSFCAAGSVAATGYGAGVGVNLNQAPNTTAPLAYAVPAGKLGVSYALTNLPPKTVLIVDNGGVAYQATLTTASAMVPWASFAIQTPDAGPPTLSGPPNATHLQFQVGVATGGANFNFCVTALGFY
jgi:hypothetical protein